MLIDQLEAYGGSDFYPFHMPGHKRQCRLGITSFPNPFSVDITEIDGFDNLHHARGILRESMEWAASVYGADQSWYLVNGSTAGILSALCGTVKRGGRLLMARNSHKAAYHAVTLNEMEPVYVYPEIIEDLGIQGGATPEAVEEALERQTGIQCVYITSPTYEGIVSDIRGIAEAAHRHGVPLIVDEAHGAHFPFGKDFPRQAIECGADAAIQSLHKTLPSLTQTAILHVKGGRIEAERIERYLQMFQSSSPSYVFLASIENCIRYMDGPGREAMEQFWRRLRLFEKRMPGLSRLELLTDTVCERDGVRARDPSKVVIFPRDGRTGTEIADFLRRQYHLEPEMACGRYALLMTSVMDTEEGFSRLEGALRELDRGKLPERGSGATGEQTGPEAKQEDVSARRSGTEQKDAPARRPEAEQKNAPARRPEAEQKNAPGTVPKERPQQVLTPGQAWEQAGEAVPLERAAGRICRTFVTVYPPGVPMLAPGERISREAAELIRENLRLGLTVEGVFQGKIEVLL